MNPALRRSIFLWISLLAVATRRTTAADTWTLTTGDLQRQTVQWSAVSGEGVTLTGVANHPVVVPWPDFVSLGRPAAPVPSDGLTALTLADGTRLVGTPVALLGDTSMQWHEAKLGLLTVPIRQIRLIDRGVVSEPVSPAQADRVQFTNGDAVTGVVIDVSADAVSLKTDAGVSNLPMTTIRRVTFAKIGGSSRPATRPAGVRLSFSLDDGSTFDATDVHSSADALTLTPVGGKAAVSFPISSIISIEQPDGPVAWLSSREPVSQSIDPFFPFGLGWTAAFDREAHRIDVHGRTSLRFEIEPGWSRLHTRYELQPADPDGPAWADVTVRIRLDDKTVFERTHVRADAPTGVIDVPIVGGKSLTLETDFGETAGAQSAINWVEPALVRQNAATRPAKNP